MYPYINKHVDYSGLAAGHDILKIGLFAPRPSLNIRIDQRIKSRVNQGMIDEAVRLRRKGLTLERMRQLGLEYRCLADLLAGLLSREQFTAQLQTKIHQYAKRQMVWFKKEPGVSWFDITSQGWIKKVEKLTSRWYNALSRE